MVDSATLKTRSISIMCGFVCVDSRALSASKVEINLLLLLLHLPRFYSPINVLEWDRNNTDSAFYFFKAGWLMTLEFCCQGPARVTVACVFYEQSEMFKAGNFCWFHCKLAAPHFCSLRAHFPLIYAQNSAHNWFTSESGSPQKWTVEAQGAVFFGGELFLRLSWFHLSHKRWAKMSSGSPHWATFHGSRKDMRPNKTFSLNFRQLRPPHLCVWLKKK